MSQSPQRTPLSGACAFLALLTVLLLPRASAKVVLVDIPSGTTFSTGTVSAVCQKSNYNGITIQTEGMEKILESAVESSKYSFVYLDGYFKDNAWWWVVGDPPYAFCDGFSCVPPEGVTVYTAWAPSNPVTTSTRSIFMAYSKSAKGWVNADGDVTSSYGIACVDEGDPDDLTNCVNNTKNGKTEMVCPSGKKKFPNWAIAVIVVGAVLVLAAIAVIVYCCCCKKKKGGDDDDDTSSYSSRSSSSVGSRSLGSSSAESSSFASSSDGSSMGSGSKSDVDSSYESSGSGTTGGSSRSGTSSFSSRSGASSSGSSRSGASSSYRSGSSSASSSRSGTSDSRSNNSSSTGSSRSSRSTSSSSYGR